MPAKRKASAKKEPPKKAKVALGEAAVKLVRTELQLDVADSDLDDGPKNGLVRIFYCRPSRRDTYGDFSRATTVFDLSKEISQHYAKHAGGKVIVDSMEWQWFYDGEILENTLTMGEIVDRGMPLHGRRHLESFTTNQAIVEVCFCILLCCYDFIGDK